MKQSARPGKHPEPRRLSRTAGVDAERMNLHGVHRRRSELWTMSLLAACSLTAALGLFSVGQEFLPEAIRLENLSQWVLLVLLGGLLISLMIYVVEKERALRRLERLLLEERVRTEGLRNRMAETARLSKVGRAINATLELPTVLDMILDAALDLLGGNEASIMLLDPQKTVLEVVSYRGAESSTVMGSQVPLGSGISGNVASDMAAKVIDGPLDTEQVGFGNPKRRIHSAMSCPLVTRGELIGVLNITEVEGLRSFTQDDLEAVGYFAEHAAIAIANARSFAKERETVTRLEELDRLKADFLANVSHELRSPLASIIGAARTIQRNGDALSQQDHDHFIEIIDRQGERLLMLVEDLLTTSKVDSGRFKLTRERIELDPFVRQIAGDLQASSLAANRQLHVEMRSDYPIVWGDAGAMQHVLRNLVENAFKYSEDGTNVWISAEERDAEVVLEVRDEGRGIPTDQIENIFERFRQLDPSDTRSVGGVGLGLAIVTGLVAAHNGRIEVDSEVDRGSVFRVRLPKRARDRTPVEPAAPDVPAAETAQMGVSSSNPV